MEKTKLVRVGVERDGWRVVRDLGAATYIGRVEVMIQCLRCGMLKRIRYDNFLKSVPKKCYGCVGGTHGFSIQSRVGAKKLRGEKPYWFKEYQEAARAQLSQEEFVKYRTALYGAWVRDLVWRVPPEEFSRLLASSCVYCGEVGPTVGVDRVDNALGYESGNLVPCCTVCNRMKWAHSLEFFLAQVAKIQAFTSKNKVAETSA